MIVCLVHIAEQHCTAKGAMAGLGPPRAPGVPPLWDTDAGDVSVAGLDQIKQLQATAIADRYAHIGPLQFM